MTKRAALSLLLQEENDQIINLDEMKDTVTRQLLSLEKADILQALALLSSLDPKSKPIHDCFLNIPFCDRILFPLLYTKDIGIASEAFNVINCWISDDEPMIIKKLYALCIMPKITKVINLIAFDWLNQLLNVKSLIINVLECIIVFMERIEASIEQLNKCELKMLLIELLKLTEDKDILDIVSKCLVVFTDENPEIIKGGKEGKSMESLSQSLYEKIKNSQGKSFFPALCESLVNIININNDGKVMIDEIWILLIGNFEYSELYLESLSNISLIYPCKDENFLKMILTGHSLTEHSLTLVTNNLISESYDIEFIKNIWNILLSKETCELDIISAKIICLRTVLQAAFENGYEELYLESKNEDDLLKGAMKLNSDSILIVLWIMATSGRSKIENIEYHRQIFANIDVDTVKDLEAYEDVESILGIN